jgi:hypothetical protein
MTDKGKNIQQSGTGGIKGKVQMNFNSAVVGVIGNVEGEQIISSSEQKRNLTEAAQEIQQLLQILEQSYLVDTTAEKMILAAEVIRRIDINPSMKQRVLNALKAGGAEAFKQLLNHPVTNILIGALEDWQQQ